MVRTAVVTGASGYVATEVVKQLLENGYDVRATVRSVSAKEKIKHLELLGQALPGKVTFYEGDLLKPGKNPFSQIFSGPLIPLTNSSRMLSWCACSSNYTVMTGSCSLQMVT